MPQVLLNFYAKPMSSPYLTLSRTALANNAKRAIIFQEGMRRILNCHPDLPWGEKAKFLTKFSYQMMISGYNKEFRVQIIKGVIQRYEQLIEKVNQGQREY